MKRTQMLTLIVILLALAGCKDRKYKTYNSYDYCKPPQWNHWNLNGKFPWDFEWIGPCGQGFKCTITCEPIKPCSNPVPAPGAFLLAAIGTGAVGWFRRKRIL